MQKENNLPAEKPETKGEELSEEALDKMKEEAQALIDAGQFDGSRNSTVISVLICYHYACSGTFDGRGAGRKGNSCGAGLHKLEQTRIAKIP